MSDLAKQPAPIAPLSAEQLADFVNKPLRQVPAEWRPVVWDFWSQWEHLLPTQLALASRLRHWISELGLTLDDAKRAFAAVNNPERMAGIRFASDLLAALATEAAAIVKDRKRAQHQRERRERDEREKAEALPGKRIKDMLAGIGRPVE